MDRVSNLGGQRSEAEKGEGPPHRGGPSLV